MRAASVNEIQVQEIKAAYGNVVPLSKFQQTKWLGAA